MSEMTMIYCLKDRAARHRVGNYRLLARILERVGSMGLWNHVTYYRAKKDFVCDNFAYHDEQFTICRGETFMLVDCNCRNAYLPRLQRGCYTQYEHDHVDPMFGVPVDDAVYMSTADYLYERGEIEDPFSWENNDNRPDENEYIKEIIVNWERADEKPRGRRRRRNHIVTYDIADEADGVREELENVRVYTERNFITEDNTKAIFRRLVKQKDVKDILKIEQLDHLTDALLALNDKWMTGKWRPTLQVHHSLVIAIMDGRTNYWRYGIWCYKPAKGKPVEYHLVYYFMPVHFGDAPTFDSSFIPAKCGEKYAAAMEDYEV